MLWKVAGVSEPTHLPPQHSDCRLQTWDWAAENTTSSLSPSPPPPSCQLPTLSTPLYRGGWRQNIKALNWFHLSSRHNWWTWCSCQLQDHSIFPAWGFPIIQVGEEKYGAMCRHGMQRSGIASMSAESVLWAAWDCCLLHQLHTC